MAWEEDGMGWDGSGMRRDGVWQDGVWRVWVGKWHGT